MPARSSQRQTSRKHYTIDAFEGIEALQDAQDGPEPSYLPKRRRPSSDDSEDVYDVRTEPPADEDEDRMKLAGDASDGNTQGVEEDFDDLDEYGDSQANTSRRVKRRGADDENRLYTNPMPDNLKTNTSKFARALYHFGPTDADQDPVNNARKQWTYEATLPSRHTDENGFGGFHQSFFFTEDERKARAEEAWGWYQREGGKKILELSQYFMSLNPEDANEYLPTDGDGDHSILMGPYKNPRQFNLSPRSSMPLGDAWRTYNSGDGTPYPLPKEYKAGFLLNLGARVQSVDWVPNQDGTEQYLAVSLLPHQDPNHIPMKSTEAPAFNPRPSSKSSIQIWKFRATEDRYIDCNTSPSLATLLCTSWGDATMLKWCPTPCPVAAETEDDSLGLLAGIWSDGAIRILSVAKPLPNKGTQRFAINKVAFEARPPNTVCSCLTWVSPTRIAAGCANGYIAVWDLPSYFSATKTKPRPSIYTPIQSTYILNIASLQPSRPQFLATTSLTGKITLTDLASPNPSSPSSTVFSRRQRIGQAVLAWNDFSQSLISAEDTLFQKAWPFRRVVSTVSTGRYPSLPTVTATSPCHPFVLSGTTGGEVLTNNAMRRVTDSRAGLWMQQWFGHEWKRTSQNPPNKNTDTNDTTKSPGLTKFTEGFTITKIELRTEEERANRKQKKSENGNRWGPGAANYTTVFEVRTAVTALAWNPNLVVGGWAAAGLADGLLRVEDLGTG